MFLKTSALSYSHFYQNPKIFFFFFFANFVCPVLFTVILNWDTHNQKIVTGKKNKGASIFMHSSL